MFNCSTGEYRCIQQRALEKRQKQEDLRCSVAQINRKLIPFPTQDPAYSLQQAAN